MRRQRQTCPDCGTRAGEWEADRLAYEGDAVRCRGCELLEQERDEIPREAKGVKVRLVPKPLVPSAEEVTPISPGG